MFVTLDSCCSGFFPPPTMGFVVFHVAQCICHMILGVPAATVTVSVAVAATP